MAAAKRDSISQDKRAAIARIQFEVSIFSEAGAAAAETAGVQTLSKGFRGGVLQATRKCNKSACVKQQTMIAKSPRQQPNRNVVLVNRHRR